MSNKHSINLLQAELLPETPLLSLKRVVIILTFTLVLMLMLIALGEYQLQAANHKNAQLNAIKAQKTTQQSNLTTQLSQRKTDPALAAELDTLKQLTQNKRILHAKLTNSNNIHVAGFAKVMQELAAIHSKNISLTHIEFAHQNMSFSGVARTPDAVPAWMSGFKNTSLLANQNFTHFKLAETKRHLTEFTVSTTTPVAGSN